MTGEWTRVAAAIPPLDHAAAAATRVILDGKTKPPGSLGRIEELAIDMAAMRGRVSGGTLRPVIVVAAADHGVVAEGVSAYPQAVTAQMVANFAAGGAAINVFARHIGCDLVVVDAGVASAAPVPQGVLNHRVRAGTRNMCREPAMTVSEAEAALDCGVAVAQQAVRAGANVVGLGEMGIGNTTAAAALAAAWVPARPARVTGRGTGVDDAGLRRKRLAVARSLRLHRPAGRTPIEVLASLGGLEIALLAGVTMGAAACRVPVVVDGFIASVAALSAVKLAPICAGYLIAAHRSVEPGHRYVLDALGLKPLLDLQLRLGEGTGAALAMPLLRVAAAIVDEMASFASAGVSRANTE